MTRPGPKVDAASRIAWNRLWPVSPVATRASASRSNSALAAVVLPRSAPSASSVSVIGGNAVIVRRGNIRRGAVSAGVLENGRWRAPPITIGTIFASALLAIWATAR